MAGHRAGRQVTRQEAVLLWDLWSWADPLWEERCLVPSGCSVGPKLKTAA